jgi:hypothetical protein
MIVQTFSEGQRLALAAHARSGETWCLLETATRAQVRLIREADALAGGQCLIDAILWSTATSDQEGLDPALLA